MTSWRRLAAGTLGLFLVVLAFLAGQLRAGADPALRGSAARTQVQPAPAPSQDEEGDGGGFLGGDGEGEDEAEDGSSGDQAPDAAPPTTHQS